MFFIFLTKCVIYETILGFHWLLSMWFLTVLNWLKESIEVMYFHLGSTCLVDRWHTEECFQNQFLPKGAEPVLLCKDRNIVTTIVSVDTTSKYGLNWSVCLEMSYNEIMKLGMANSWWTLETISLLQKSGWSSCRHQQLTLRTTRGIRTLSGGRSKWHPNIHSAFPETGNWHILYPELWVSQPKHISILSQQLQNYCSVEPINVINGVSYL